MKFTRKGYGRLHRADDTVVSQHVVAEEAYERAAKEGPGRYVYHPAAIQIDVPAVDCPVEPPVPEPPPVDPPPADPPPVVTEPPPVEPPPSGNLPTRLLQKGNLTRLGSFRVPQINAADQQTLAYTGHALAYNPVRNSLYICGMVTTTRVAEISIPAVGGRATLLQSPFDVGSSVVGRIGDEPIANEKRIGGLLVAGGGLLVNVYAYYDGASQAKRSICRGSLTLGSLQGPYRMSPQSQSWWTGYPGPVARYMGHIPPEWQTALGGPAFTGGSTGVTSIAAAQSNGPAFAVFDPADVDGRANVPCRMLLGYPVDQPLRQQDRQSSEWNFTSSPAGCVLPAGTASALFFGAHGTGPYSYPPAAPPYRAYVWAYDAHDLAAVRAGQRAPQSVQPYAIWDMGLGDLVPNGIGGACINGDLLYVMQRQADGTLPIIHVFRVT